MISTRDLRLLPQPTELWRVLQSMSMLDAILCPEWEYRYYSCQAEWGKGETFAEMRNGSGDSFYALFQSVGSLIIDFAHEYPMTPYANTPPAVCPGVLDDVPADLRLSIESLRDDVTGVIDATFCIWNAPPHNEWVHGDIASEQFSQHPDPDGSEYLLSALDGDPATYHSWAQEYFDPGDCEGGFTIPLDSVRHIYDHRALTAEIVSSLNPLQSLEELAEDIQTIGYPTVPT